MVGTWPADVSKRDVSLALCQDKLHDQDEEATVGKERAMSMHLVLTTHIWHVIF